MFNNYSTELVHRGEPEDEHRGKASEITSPQWMRANRGLQGLGLRINAAAMPTVCVATFGLLLLGCVTSPAGGGPVMAPRAFAQAETHSLLTGPVGVLLGNSEGYRAHVTVIQNTMALRKPSSLSGELVAQHDRLLWTPTPSKTQFQDGADMGFSFIWHLSQNRGYVLSDALQGCAPVTASLRFTNSIITPDPERSPPEKLEGHRCAPEQITAFSSDGSTHSFKAWCAAELKGLPLKIVAAGETPASTVLLSQVRLVKPPPDMFEPPSGFTRYENAEALANELLLRRQNLQRRSDSASPEHGAPDHPAPGQGHPAMKSY